MVLKNDNKKQSQKATTTQIEPTKSIKKASVKSSKLDPKRLEGFKEMEKSVKGNTHQPNGSDDELMIADVVEELNKKHATIKLDQVYYLTETINPVFGYDDFTLESKQSFKNYYENKIVILPSGKNKTKADIWLKHESRREFDGIIFNPVKEGHSNNYYNLWKGFSKNSKKGNCSLFWQHVKENICNNNQEAYTFVRKWTSSVFQHPDEVHTGLILCGSQGIGKNSFVEPLGNLLGQHYVLLSNVSELVSNFNYHLKYAVLIHANEALWGGNRKEIGTLKAMITEKTCLIEGKGKDRIMVPNFKHVILSSNEDWPVHLDRDDRRFFVLSVSEAHKEDHAYFKAIQDQLDKGGYEALLYDLLHEDLSGFNPRRFPDSAGAFHIKLQSAKSIDKYVYDALTYGCFDVGNPTPNGIWKNEMSKGSVYTDYKAWCSHNGERQLANSVFGKSFRKLLPSVSDGRPHVDQVKVCTYNFPSLTKTREEFEKAFKATKEIWTD